MSNINFPPNPTDGLEYIDPTTGVVWTYNNSRWNYIDYIRTKLLLNSSYRPILSITALNESNVNLNYSVVGIPSSVPVAQPAAAVTTATGPAAAVVTAAATDPAAAVVTAVATDPAAAVVTAAATVPAAVVVTAAATVPAAAVVTAAATVPAAVVVTAAATVPAAAVVTAAAEPIVQPVAQLAPVVQPVVPPATTTPIANVAPNSPSAGIAGTGVYMGEDIGKVLSFFPNIGSNATTVCGDGSVILSNIGRNNSTAVSFITPIAKNGDYGFAGTLNFIKPINVSDFVAGDNIYFWLSITSVTEYITIGLNLSGPSPAKISLDTISKETPLNQWFKHYVILTPDLIAAMDGSLLSISVWNYQAGTTIIDDIGLIQTMGGSIPCPQTPANLLAGAPYYPPNNYYRKNISAAPVHKNSSSWITLLGGSSTHLHADFGAYSVNGILQYGIPVNIFDTIKDQHIKLNTGYLGDELPIDIAIANNFPYNPLTYNIEVGSDNHLIVVDTQTGGLGELWQFNPGAPGTTGSVDGVGTVTLPWATDATYWNLNSNASRPWNLTSADASGLPIYPGLLKYDDVANGPLLHAVRFTANNAPGWIYPASHKTLFVGSSDDGLHSDSNLPGAAAPMGARFRLKADFDISNYPPIIQNILIGLKNYGMVLQDNGSPGYISGEPDVRWSDDVLNLLKQITIDQFEAVDMTPYIVRPTSLEML